MSEPFRQRRRALGGPAQPALVVIERPTVVDIEEVEAERLRRVIAERVADENHVPVRLRHLLPAEPHLCHVDPEPHERTLPGRGLALGDLVLVMRVDEVISTSVDVQPGTEVTKRHRRTLDVPPGPTATEPARPGRSIGDVAPQSEIDRIATARIVEPCVVLLPENAEHLSS